MQSLLTRAGLDQGRLNDHLTRSLHGADDGELFVEARTTEAYSFDDGRIKAASFDIAEGFGLRAVAGEATAYAHSTSIDEDSLQRAGQAVRGVLDGHSGTLALAPSGSNRRLYADTDPIHATEQAGKIALLQGIDAYARGKDPRVVQVSASLTGSHQIVEILRPDGASARDVRPLVRLNVQVVVKDGDKMENGGYGAGGRVTYDHLMASGTWQRLVDKALAQALIKLDARPCPAGEIPVVLGPGWPGILLHEAVGHGLEGDFNRKKTSAFSNLMGQQVASKGVTVVDDGTIPDRRGSITIDDEGSASAHNVLIEDGKLVGYMQDRLNARLMGVPPTGNGRRQSYAHMPMPRMTNTYMLNGAHDPQEIIEGVERGLYMVQFGGGQVDITSGKFVFTAAEAYMIENGKITAPVKGATLIGNGADALTKIKQIGNDMALDEGIGTCGKDGQWVPVGVGQPSLRIDGLTVGGTAL